MLGCRVCDSGNESIVIKWMHSDSLQQGKLSVCFVGIANCKLMVGNFIP